MIWRFVWLLFLLPCPVFALPEAAKINAIFRDWKGNVPGGAVGVVSQGKLVFSKGYGYADLAKRRPNSPQTVYDLASVSKQFTATAALLQAQKGQLDLQAPLGKIFPSLPVYARGIAVKSLLTMQSGLPDYDYEGALDLKSLVSQLHDAEPSFDPGEQYEYLNMNYALLTYVVQKAAGQPLGQVMQSEIFQPLKMTHTVFLSTKGQKIPNRAVGYSEDDGWVVAVDDAPGVGDGNVFSSVDDLSLWARDLMAGSSLLKPEWLKKAWTNYKTSDGEPTGYGYGFEIDKHGGHTRISHTGSWAGTSTYIALYPQRKLSVIVLSNREDADCYGLGEQVEDLYLSR